MTIIQRKIDFIDKNIYFEFEEDKSLLVYEENKVAISSHIWVASTTFKQFWNIKKKIKKRK